jgi:ubiquinone/menaquinone biosynthesis C-methylase UbiE
MTAKESPRKASGLSREEARLTYARLARAYDAWGILTESKAADTALQAARIRDGEAVLEVAVGTGRLFARIVAANPSGRNEGIDLSAEMLAGAKKRLKSSATAYRLQVADAYVLPFEGKTFDLVVCNYMFDLLPEQDMPLVLDEFLRVLRPGGRAVITSWTPARHWYSKPWDWLIRVAPGALEGCRPISIGQAVRQAGFVNVTEHYVTQLTFPSVVVRGEKP